MSFDARHPGGTLVPAIANGGTLVAVAKLPPDVLHEVGETFAVALSRLQTQLGSDSSPESLRAALAEVARLERLGVQMQEIARVLAREGNVATERVDLAAAAQQALGLWAARAAQLGATLAGPGTPCEAEVNPAVIAQLLSLGIEYALHLGPRIELRCDRQGEPPFPVLGFVIHQGEPAAAVAADGGVNDLQWLLFCTLARASGFAPQRQMVGQQVLLSVALVVDHEAAQAGMRSAALLPKTPIAVGRRVLLVDPMEASRIQAQRLLHEVGMQVDAAASIAQAQDGLRSALHWPDVLVTGFAVDQPACSAFIDLLRARQPRLRVVELVNDDSAFAFSVPGSAQPARVGRHTLARTLVAAISQELDSV